jgi:hypothetical protein
VNDQELVSFLDDKLPRRTFYISFLFIFIPCYVYCIVTYGLLWGLGVGWLPCGIVAFAFWVLTSRALRKLIIWYDPVVRGNIRRRRREAVNLSQPELGPGQQLLQQYRAAVAKLLKEKQSAASPSSLPAEPARTGVGGALGAAGGEVLRQAFPPSALDLFNTRMRRVIEGATPEQPGLAFCRCTFELCGHAPGERCGREATIRLRYSISLGPAQYNHFGPVEETGLCPACWRTIFANFPEPLSQANDKC